MSLDLSRSTHGGKSARVVAYVCTDVAVLRRKREGERERSFEGGNGFCTGCRCKLGIGAD